MSDLDVAIALADTQADLCHAHGIDVGPVEDYIRALERLRRVVDG